MSSRYRELTAKVDAFFARVVARHRADMQCGAGCDMCCHTRFTITGVEAADVERFVGAMDDGARAHLASIVRRPLDERDPRCAALDDDGRCLIYDARPLVCRSHGAPIRLQVEYDGRSLPIVQCCSLNFPRGPERADPDCVLDQQTLSALLAAVDADDADTRGRPRGERVALAALLERLTGDR